MAEIVHPFKNRSVELAVPKPVCILVLGTHRSGTSAATRVFNLLGAKLPEKTVGPAASNLRGHWEPASLVALHEELLRAGGSSWDDLARFDIGQLNATAQAGFRNRILRILQSEYGNGSDFIVKDPRICRFLPFWLDILAEFGAEPKIVVPLRNPLEVAASLATRDRMDRTYAQFLWLRYALDAEHDSRHLPRAFFTFADLLEDWRAAITALNSKMQLGLVLTEAKEKEIDDFLSADLRHQRSTDNDQAGQTPSVDEAFQLLSSLCRSEDPKVLRHLDEIREAFERDTPAFLRASRSELEQRRQHLEEIVHDHHLKAVAVDELRVSVTTQTARAETLLHQVYETNLHVAQLGTEIGRLNTELHYRNLEITNLSGALQQSYKDADLRVAQADLRIAQINRETAEIKSSLSWRLTTPIRRVGTKFPGVARAASSLARILYWTVSLRLLSRLRAQRALAENARVLRESSLFDPDFYRASNPDVPSNMDPFLHYLKSGANDGRQPSRAFDSESYLRSNPDVQASGENPLLHYLRNGAAEARSVNWPADATVEDRLRAVIALGELELAGSGDIELEDGDLIASGRDPSIRFRSTKPLRPGWHQVDVILHSTIPLAPEIVFDFGAGYSDAGVVKLRATDVGRFSSTSICRAKYENSAWIPATIPAR